MSTKTTLWTPIFALANVSVSLPIETPRLVLAPHRDPRVRAVAEAHPTFEKFLNAFRNNFGQAAPPSILLAPPGATRRLLRAEPLSSFRDVVAMAAMLPNYGSLLANSSFGGIYFSDSFDIYPWMIGRDFGMLVGWSRAVRALGTIDGFRAQHAPEIPHQTLSPGNLDRPLFDRLIERWQRRYFGKTLADDVSLFRSLNIARRAMRVPADRGESVYDIGVAIGLWVSAFEILAHPGGSQNVHLGRVLELIEQTRWTRSDSARRRVVTYWVKGKQVTKGHSFAARVYIAMYAARNAFLHGSPVAGSNLRMPSGAKASLFNLAPAVYRLALSTKLGLHWNEPVPSPSDADAFGSFVNRRMNFNAHQERVEDGLLVARARPKTA